MQRILSLALALAVASCSSPERRFSSAAQGGDRLDAAPDAAASLDAGVPGTASMNSDAQAANQAELTTADAELPDADLDAAAPAEGAPDAAATPTRDAGPAGLETETTDACAGGSSGLGRCNDRCSATLECCHDEDCMAGSRCVDSQCEDTLPPQITAFSPLDGATGVLADAVIEVTFSEPMNTAAVEAALSVSSVPQNQLDTSWNAKETTLSITPKGGLVYSNATSESDPARSYTVTIGTAARDRAGNRLDAPSSFSFATMRKVARTLSPSAAGNYTTYGRAVGDSPLMCPTSTDSVRTGWWTAIASSGTGYGFVRFDIDALSKIHALESATFVAEQLAPDEGFYPSGKVILEKLQPGRIDVPTVLDLDITHEYGTFAASAATPKPSLEVTPEVNADRHAGTTQLVFRLNHSGEPENSAEARFSCAGFGLDVIYLTP